MPVTSFRSTSAPPAAPAASPPAPAPSAIAAGDVVGHGVTRLMPRAKLYGDNVKLIPGTPPPRGETAGAHGAHKGRISIR